MSLNSVNTNATAYVAVQNLDATGTSLAATQKQISTGYRVADAIDDGGAFAVAQQVRSNVGALTTVNQQLGNAQGLVTTALSSLTSISDVVGQAKGTLVKIADQSISSDQRNNYIASYRQLVQQVANAVDNSSYNGQSLLGAASGPVAGASLNVINNEAGATTTLFAQDVSTLPATLAGLIGDTFSRSPAGVDSFTPTAPFTVAETGAAQTTAIAALQPAAGFDTTQTGVNDQLNATGAAAKSLDAQITLNSAKIDSLNSGLGSLVDADLTKEAALLQAQQIKQQLGTQTVSIANQAPQSLLSLFKGA